MKFPVDCAKHVLNHLSGQELKNYTLVCPSWNEFIGQTKSCMEKIQLEFPDYKGSEVKNILKNSKRKYENLKLVGKPHNHDDDDGKYSEDIREILLANKGRWTSVRCIGSLVFETVNDFLGFLCIIESSVRRLLLWQTSVKGDFTPDHSFPDLLFP